MRYLFLTCALVYTLQYRVNDLEREIQKLKATQKEQSEIIDTMLATQKVQVEILKKLVEQKKPTVKL